MKSIGEKRIVDIKTYIPELGVWVSTVAFDGLIGLDRVSETMVFRGNEKGITDYGELYFEPHGYTTDKEKLERRHKEIVEAIKSGEIKLHEPY